MSLYDRLDLTRPDHQKRQKIPIWGRLDHSDLNTDVMHDGLDHRVHSLMPPSFHAEQIVLMNHAISKHKGVKRSL